MTPQYGLQTGRVGGKAAQLLAVVLAPPALADSVWWEWWPNVARCNEGDESDSGRRVEWTTAGVCHPLSDFADNDPLRRVGQLAFFNESADVVYAEVHCLSVEDVADGDIVVAYAAASCPGWRRNASLGAAQLVTTVRGGVCNGSVVAEIQGNTSLTSNRTLVRLMSDALAPLRLRCTTCEWIFYGEVEPPYSMLAAGIFVFLVVSLVVNWSLQRRLDNIARNRKRICPALFGYPLMWRELDLVVRPGCNVWICPQEPEGRDKRKSLQVGAEITDLTLGAREKAAAANQQGPAAAAGGATPPALDSPRGPPASPRQRQQAELLDIADDASAAGSMRSMHSGAKRTSWPAGSLDHGTPRSLTQRQHPACAAPPPPAPSGPVLGPGSQQTAPRPPRARLTPQRPHDAGDGDILRMPALPPALPAPPVGRGGTRWGGPAAPPRPPPQRRWTVGCRPLSARSRQAPPGPFGTPPPPGSPHRFISTPGSLPGPAPPPPPPVLPFPPAPPPAGRKKKGRSVWERRARRHTSPASGGSLSLPLLGTGGDDVVGPYAEHGAADEDRLTLQLCTSQLRSVIAPPRPTKFPPLLDQVLEQQSRLDLPPPPEHGPPGIRLGPTWMDRAMGQWARARRDGEQEADRTEERVRQANAQLRPHEKPIRPEDEVAKLPSLAERVATQVGNLWPKRDRDTIRAPRNVRHCVVCGSVEPSADPDGGRELELREQGWKCVGTNKRDTCIGRQVNHRLRAHKIPDGWSSAKAQIWALEGQFGQFGDVVQLRHANSNFSRGRPHRLVEALVIFQKPQAWLSAEVVKRLGDHRKPAHHHHGARKHKAERDPVQAPRLFVAKEKEDFWEQLCITIGFHELHVTAGAVDDSQWIAIQLHDDVPVWLPTVMLTKVGDFWLDHVRVGEVSEVRDAAFTNWEEWWADFCLCVGSVRDVRRVVKGDEARFHVTVEFEASATITLPAEVLRQCQPQEFMQESLLVPQSVPDRALHAVFVAHPALLLLKALFLSCYYFYAVSLVTREGHGGRLGRRNNWERYEELYFRLFNSGYPTLMADFGAVFIYRMTMQDAGFAKLLVSMSRPVLLCVIISLAISVPGIVTHCLPMYVLYGWMWVPATVIAYRTLRLLRNLAPSLPESDPERMYDIQHWRKHHKMFLIKTSFFFVSWRFVAEMFAIITLQTNFNYATMWYDRRYSFLDTMKQEYNLRETACIAEKAYKLATYLW